MIIVWVAGLRYITKGGDTAVIYATDAGGPNPIHGRIIGRQAGFPTAWNAKGKWSAPKNEKDHEFDLTGLVLQSEIAEILAGG
jgi:pSer/pThr/pTyr-binding forkhead associated (FHA) protein